MTILFTYGRVQRVTLSWSSWGFSWIFSLRSKRNCLWNRYISILYNCFFKFYLFFCCYCRDITHLQTTVKIFFLQTQQWWGEWVVWEGRGEFLHCLATSAFANSCRLWNSSGSWRDQWTERDLGRSKEKKQRGERNSHLNGDGLIA